MTYAEWYTLYMQTYKRDLRPRTCDSYAQLSRLHILPTIGDAELEAITPEVLQLVLLAAADRSGPRTAQAVYALLRAVFRRAVRSRRLIWSPVDAVDRPNHTASPGIALTPEDYDAALPHVLADTALSLALLAGLRRGEICGLRWADIDLPGRCITVRRQLIRVNGILQESPPKSAAGVRTVPICAELLPILRKSYRLAPSSFVVRCAPETISRRWRTIQQRDVALSRSYRLHDLRHTYVTRLLLAGAIPRVVQYVAGHSSIDVTLRTYAHVTPRDALLEIDRVASLTAAR